MAIEIRELVIRATVASRREGRTASQPPADKDREEIVAECVEQVLDVLRLEKER